MGFLLAMEGKRKVIERTDEGQQSSPLPIFQLCHGPSLLTHDPVWVRG